MRTGYRTNDIYGITQEEFLFDFMPLPLLHRGILFSLRCGYFIKNGALDALDIAGLCPTIDIEHKKALQAVLNKFFYFDNGLWKKDEYEQLLASRKAREEQEKIISKKRASAGRAGANNRWKEKTPKEHLPILESTKNTMANATQNNSISIANDTNLDSNCITSSIHSNVNCIENIIQSDNNYISNANGGDGKCLINSEEYIALNSPNSVVKPNIHGDSEDLTETADETAVPAPHASAHTYARASDSDSDNFINKKNIKNKSVSESVSDKQVEQLFAQENRECSVDEFLSILKYFGLDEKNLKGWMRRKAENQQAIDDLVRDFKNFDLETFQAVFSRCQAAKDKENKPLSSAIAFVVKSLQRESAALRNRSKPTAPKKFAERDYYAGVVKLPDGTLRAAPKQGPQRDYTKGLIQLPDGTWKIDPNYKK